MTPLRRRALVVAGSLVAVLALLLAAEGVLRLLGVGRAAQPNDAEFTERSLNYLEPCYRRSGDSLVEDFLLRRLGAATSMAMSTARIGSGDPISSASVPDCVGACSATALASCSVMFGDYHRTKRALRKLLGQTAMNRDQRRLLRARATRA